MDTAEYHSICARPDVLPRSAIEATAWRLAPQHRDLRRRLDQLAQTIPVAKPERHEGGPDTDFFVIDLTNDELDALVNALGGLEAGLAQPPGGSPQELTLVADLLDSWNAALMYRNDAT